VSLQSRKFDFPSMELAAASEVLVATAISRLNTLGAIISWILCAVIASLSNSSSQVGSTVCMLISRYYIHNDFNRSSDTLSSARSLIRLKKRGGH